MEPDFAGQKNERDEGVSDSSHSHLKLTVEEIKSYQIFSKLTDEQAEKVAESLFKYCIIASQTIDNQYNGLVVVKDKSTDIIQLKQSNRKAA